MISKKLQHKFHVDSIVLWWWITFLSVIGILGLAYLYEQLVG